MQVKSRVRGAAAVVVVIASVGLGAFSQTGLAAADSATPAGPGGTWGQALAVPGVNALATVGTESDGDFTTAISCTSPGECTAVGGYTVYNPTTHATTTWPMVVSQSGGAWEQAAALPGIAALSSGLGGKLTEVSCGSAGNCSATGGYNGPGNTSFAFLANEVDGTWGAVQAVPDAPSLGARGSYIAAISCPSAGDCAAVGSHSDTQFVLNEVDGSWGDPLTVPGLATLGIASNAGFDSVSCADAGDCTAIGTVADGSGVQSAVVVTETDGTWGDATVLPGQAALSSAGSWGDSVSCPAAGDCTAIGGYEPTRTTWRVWVADEVNGTWGSAQPLAAPVTTGNARGTLSCATAGNCAVAGDYVGGGEYHAFVANEVNGSWQAGQDVPGLSGIVSNAGAVSCAAPGDCAATGAYDVSGIYQEYSTDEVNGTWGVVTALPGGPPTAADITSMSCTAPGYCSAVGGLESDRSLVSEATGTATTVTVAAAKVSYADEQAAPLTVSVTSPAGGTPTGTVIVTTAPLQPTAPACTVTLSGGTGTCAFPATRLTPGSYHLTAIYNGDMTYAASGSATTAALTVIPATTTATSLTLSATKAVYGHESVVRLSTVTTAQYGGPFVGRVLVQDGVPTVCSFAVTAGRGSCLLPDTALGVGTGHLTAIAYPSNGGFASSVSASHALTIVKGADTTTLALSRGVVAFGHENAARLAVRVQTRYHGIPNGRVEIKLGSTILGVFSSAQAVAGSWVLPARLLPRGTFSIVAVYEGNASFAGSTSGRVTLKVT
jgi:hypothetical protein